MKNSYLQTYKLKSPHRHIFNHKINRQQYTQSKLPPIKNNLQYQQQKSLMIEIQNLDASLNNKNFRYFEGLLFETSNPTTLDKAAQSLRVVLRYGAAVMEDGFSIWNQNIQTQHNQTTSSSLLGNEHRLTKKVQSFNERMKDLSFKNVHDYDIKKYIALMSKNKQRWSLFKRNYVSSFEKQMNPEIRVKQQMKKKQSSNLSLEVIDEVSYANTSKNGNIINNTAKQSRVSGMTKISSPKSYHTNHNSTQKKRSTTEISENLEQDSKKTVSKYQIKGMLQRIINKNKQMLIILWLPPASYPQFNGMFTYSFTKKMVICKIKRYFFFRRTLSYRLFNGIMQQISARQDCFIEGLQMLINRDDYAKAYEPIGWKMKSMQSMNKIRIKLSRKIQKKY